MVPCVAPVCGPGPPHQGLVSRARARDPGWHRVAAYWLVLAGHVVQHPLYEGIPIIGTGDDGVHFPPGFVLALALTLVSPVVKGLIHIPLNQIPLFFSEGVLRFSDVNRGDRKALLPWLRYDAVDTHEVRGVGLFKAPIHIVEFRGPSLGWHGLSLSVLIDTLSSR